MWGKASLELRQKNKANPTVDLIDDTHFVSGTITDRYERPSAQYEQ